MTQTHRPGMSTCSDKCDTHTHTHRNEHMLGHRNEHMLTRHCHLYSLLFAGNNTALPMNWDFDYGAKSGQQPVKLGEQVSLIKKGGSDNLKIELTAASELLFSLDVSNKDNATLIVRKK